MDYSYFCSKRLTAVMAVCLSFPTAALAAQETDVLRVQQSNQQQIHSMKQRLLELESRLKTAETSPPILATAPAAANRSGIQIGLSGLFASGVSSVDNNALEGLQGGAHDPKQNGFTVQNVELSISSTVDAYLDAQANIIFQIDADGETVVELEEAFFITRSLPWGLQIKGGQYFTEFGRQNKKHPHTWAFVDQPVVLSRFFGGDGLRSQGLRVSWLMPTDWYSELNVGLQNPKGETVTSFLNAPGEEVGGHTLINRDARNLGDMLHTARWLNGFDVSDTVSVNLGVSGLWGPNASGTTTDTTIVGADLYLKWQPATTQRGFPFVSWHTELLTRRYEAADSGDPRGETLKDRGLFSQALWGFKPGWVAGLRWEYATANGDTAADPQRDTRKRLSPNLSWYPSEYSKLRLQYNRDWTQHLSGKTADTLWLQMEFNIGSHAAHIF